MTRRPIFEDPLAAIHYLAPTDEYRRKLLPHTIRTLPQYPKCALFPKRYPKCTLLTTKFLHDIIALP
jgi:hypothetical protein